MGCMTVPVRRKGKLRYTAFSFYIKLDGSTQELGHEKWNDSAHGTEEEADEWGKEEQ